MEHICEFCKRKFTRSDVRRLHYKKCRIRVSTGAQIPKPARRGRKTRSCDSCALSKRGCDQRQPCSDCISRGSTCTYTRAPVASSSVSGISAESTGPSIEDSNIVPVEVIEVPVIGIDSSPDFNSDVTTEPNGSQWLTHSQSPPVRSTTVLAFLRNFTSTRGIATGFQYTSNGDWPEFLPANFMIEMPSDALSMLSNTSPNLLEGSGVQQIADYTSSVSSWMSFDGMGPGLRDESWNFNNLTVARPLGTFEQLSSIDMVDWIIDPLFPKSREILMRFRKIGLPGQLTELAARSPAISIQSRQCLQFFSPPNIKRLIELFWKFWYPHCPIIHFATFNPVTAPAALIIAMVLLGAVASPTSNDKDLARRYFDLAEHIAFEDFETSRISDLTGTSGDIPRPTGLQATFLICCLQNWEGDSEASARVRRGRFTIMVNSVKDSGLGQMKHTTEELGTDFSWKRYIAKEESIRISTFIFLVNTSFVFFNNTRSRLALEELHCGFLTPQECFRADTARSCYQKLQVLYPPGSLRATLPVWRAVELVRTNTLSDEEYTIFWGLDTLNLFSIISGLVLWVFQQPSSLFNIPSFEEQTRNMLHTWSLFWATRSDKHLNSADVNNYGSMDRHGFYEHADEYRQYALGLLRLRQTSQHHLEAKSANSTILPLHKSDETSMEQVSELLTLLQTLNIQ